ncbi:hypothetical protein DEG01_016225, partial [Xanthomonas vasicola]
KRLGMAAMALVLCIGAALPGRAEAALHHAFEANNANALYIMRNRIFVPRLPGFAGSGFGSTLACRTVPLAKRNPPCLLANNARTAARQIYRCVVTNHVELTGPWPGWRAVDGQGRCGGSWRMERRPLRQNSPSPCPRCGIRRYP